MEHWFIGRLFFERNIATGRELPHLVQERSFEDWGIIRMQGKELCTARERIVDSNGENGEFCPSVDV